MEAVFCSSSSFLHVLPKDMRSALLEPLLGPYLVLRSPQVEYSRLPEHASPPNEHICRYLRWRQDRREIKIWVRNALSTYQRLLVKQYHYGVWGCSRIKLYTPHSSEAFKLLFYHSDNNFWDWLAIEYPCSSVLVLPEHQLMELAVVKI